MDRAERQNNKKEKQDFQKQKIIHFLEKINFTEIFK